MDLRAVVRALALPVAAASGLAMASLVIKGARLAVQPALLLAISISDDFHKPLTGWLLLELAAVIVGAFVAVAVARTVAWAAWSFLRWLYRTMRGEAEVTE